MLEKEEEDIRNLELKIRKHQQKITETEDLLYKLIPRPKKSKKSPAKAKTKSAKSSKDQETQVKEEDVTPPPKPALDIYGASIMDDLNADTIKTRLSASSVRSKTRRGAKLEVTGRKLAQLDKPEEKIKDVLIGPASNNIASDPEEKIKRIYKQVTNSAQKRYRFVFVSSIIPRREPQLDKKITRINAFLECLCAESENLIFVDNDLFFRDINSDSRISDLFRSEWNIHPNTLGSKVLEDSICSAISGFYCACGLSH